MNDARHFREEAEADRMKTKPTPGPWRWIAHDHSMGSLVGPDEMYDHVLSVSPCDSCQKEGESPFDRCTSVYQNDMNLIAAAPDLLEALKKIESEISYMYPLLSEYAREVIKKAEQ